MLRQRSRPYLFSNSLPPAVVGASIEMFKMLGESDALHDKLVKNVEHFRKGMMAAGFDIKPTQSAICAVISTMPNCRRISPPVCRTRVSS